MYKNKSKCSNECPIVFFFYIFSERFQLYEANFQTGSIYGFSLTSLKSSLVGTIYKTYILFLSLQNYI